MEAHPGIVFRSGPAGRRAGLVGGPDVWEVIALLGSLETRGEAGVSEAAEWLGLSESNIRAAIAYYSEFPEEIDHRIQANEEAAERARRTAEIQRRLLG